jgi:peptidoglycan/LPS O-acetylase OafA/YrhL
VTAKAAREHLYYVDLVRVLTVALVIGTHVLALSPIAPTTTLGVLTIIFHVSREVFFLLTAFVLTYTTVRRKPRWLSFWRKRYLFVAVPYVVWTVIYYFANGGPFSFGPFFQELLSGTARYHLYFLLVSMQIYLVFPVIRWLLRATDGHHGALLAACAVFQLLFSLAVQQNWSLGALSGWVRSPDALLPSYLGYVVAGAIAGWHREGLVAWTRAHLKLVFSGFVAANAFGVGVYLVQLLVGGQPVLAASYVWQPAVAVESVAFAWTFLALGLLWQERGLPGRAIVMSTSDASFGVYLLHPLLLQYGLALFGGVGLVAYAQTVPSGLVLLVMMVVLVPLLYVVAGLVTTALRRTPVSLPLTGRPRRRPPVPVHKREDLALATSGGMR